jgi:uncharacterized protein
LNGTSARDPRIDALRGAALSGILLVNIQSYLYGAINPIGFLETGASALDRIAHFITATFVAGKFMPLFGMLFGAGFSLLYAKLKTTVADPRAAYRRRLVFLFLFGIGHGLLFYFADITHAYALAGFVLLLYADRDVAFIARATLAWWVFAAVWTLLLIVPSIGASSSVPVEWIEEARLNFEASVRLGYLDQWPLRAGLFAWQVQANLLALPSVVALMMTGVLAHRSGWLEDLDNPAWSRAATLGLAVGLPAALGYGIWSSSHASLEENILLPAWVLVLQFLGPALSIFYAVVFLRRAPAVVVDWLAPAGRMPLTNYLLQSVAMGALLSGWGFALGISAGYAEVSVLALGVFALQVFLSRWWLARHAQGPLEAAWRAWTYHGLKRAAPT